VALKVGRGDERGILTPCEAEQLEKSKIGLMGCHRDARRRIKNKTMKAMINDLPLIFEKTKPKDIVGYDFFYPEPSRYTYEFLKNLMIYCYVNNMLKIREERHAKGRKTTVDFKDAWKPVKEAIEEAKKEIGKHIDEHWVNYDYYKNHS